MKRIMIYGLLAAIFSLGACKSWIDVTPTDRIAEDELFKTRKGILKALNGVYVDLAEETLYGRNLSAGAIDVMAQYYNVNQSHSYRQFSYYQYEEALPKSTFDAIWQRAYARISDLNIIIENCGNGNSLLNDTFFGIIKGEALALRAMLHLDLFRIFGPTWSEENKNIESIPYMKRADQEVQPLLSGEKLYEEIFTDLDEALFLLEDVDPVIIEGVLNSSDESEANDLRYRQYRLNYYAAKALLMRTYMTFGKTEDALTIANEIIHNAADIFPFVTNDDALHTTTPDRVFSTEVMFSLYKSNRINLFNSLFSSNLQDDVRLTLFGTFASGRINELYPDQNDYRYRKGWSTNVTDDAVVLYCAKYENLPGSETIVSRCNFMVPLIRMSEVYLTAAECTTDLYDGIDYLNRVRVARGCVSAEPDDLIGLKKLVDDEFRREVIGEGQLFFRYKRQGKEEIFDGTLITGNISMTQAQYVVPLPDSEKNQRVIEEDNNEE